MPVCEADGHAIGYHEAGPADAPLVLFAHCSLGHGGLWKGVMTELADNWRCIATDLPGHGQTDRGDEAISLQDQAGADIATLAGALADGRAHLVGLSIGGAVMARAAVRRPGLAKSLALLEPILMHLLSDDHAARAEENHAVMAECYAACGRGEWREGARAFMEGWGQPGQFDKFPEAAKEAVGRAMKWIYRDFPMAHSWIPGQIGREDLAGVTVPTILMQGERTQESAKAVVTEVASIMPHAEFWEVPGAGHLSPVDDPKAVAARLRQFLEAAEASG